MTKISYVWMPILLSTQLSLAGAVNCDLLVTPEKAASKVIKIVNQQPGAELKDGIFCNAKTLHGFQKFEAPDGSPWIFSIYADRPRETFVNIRIYEVSQGEAPQIDLAVKQSPCQLVKSNNAVSAQLKTKSGAKFSLNLRCK
jgi:hypothetical protein